MLYRFRETKQCIYKSALKILVRRSRTLNFKDTHEDCYTPVRSQSTIGITTSHQSHSRERQLNATLKTADVKETSNYPESNINPFLTTITDHDNDTQIPLKPLNRPLLNASSTSSQNVPYPNVTQLVSPHASATSTPARTGSDLELEEEDPSSDESWGMLLRKLYID